MRKPASLLLICLSMTMASPAVARHRKHKPPPASVTQCGGRTDFDHDGFADLAVGVPNEDPGTDTWGAGAVNVIYGTASGLSGARSQFWHQDSPGIVGGAEGTFEGDPSGPEGDHFGSALSTGDFNGDGFDDLAIGVPQEHIEDVGGAVNVIYGSATGLTATDNELWTVGTPHVRHGDEPNGLFGSSVFACDFDGDGIADLAIGAPLESIGGVFTGVVHVLYGTKHGLDTDGNQIFSEGVGGIAGTAEGGEQFGLGLGGGDLNGDRFADLVVGAPFKDAGGGTIADTGALNVIFGSGNGLSAAGDQHLTQDDVDGQPAQENDIFGYDFAVGDFDHDGHNELAVGAPARTVSSATSAGAIDIFRTSSAGVSTDGVTYLTQGSGDVGGAPEQDDNFAQSVSAADFDGDGITDLAIGSGGETVGAAIGAGAIDVMHGSTSGLGPSVTFTQDTTNIADDAEMGDSFGSSLVASDYNHDGKNDLTVGVAFEDVGAVSGAGLVNVLYAADAPGSDFFTQDKLGSPSDASEEPDRFGFALG